MYVLGGDALAEGAGVPVTDDEADAVELPDADDVAVAVGEPEDDRLPHGVTVADVPAACPET